MLATASTDGRTPSRSAHAAPGFNVVRCQGCGAKVDRGLISGVVERTLAEKAADGGHAVAVADPGIAVDRHGVEEERAIPRPPPWDDIEIKALACADSLADGEKAIVQDVIDFLRWCHGDLERKPPLHPRVPWAFMQTEHTRASGEIPSIGERCGGLPRIDELAKSLPEIPREPFG